jgi:hypothetical protein
MTMAMDAAPKDAASTRGELLGKLQKIDVRAGLEAPPGFDFDALLAVFGRWRQEPDQEILDLADYLHVPTGPGCLLVSKRWHFGIDFESPAALRLFFSTRKGLEGTLEDRIAEAIRQTLSKGARLVAEPELAGKVQVRGGEIELTINDRLIAPNTPEVDALVRPALARVLDRLWGENSYELARDARPAARLGYTAHARSSVPDIGALLAKLGGGA